jgi:hypothetical protein
MRHDIGMDNFLFAMDYPHAEGTWPETLDWIRATFDEVPEEEVCRILGENAIGCLGLERAAQRPAADRIGLTTDELRNPTNDVDSGLLAAFNRRSRYGAPP